MDIRKWSSFGAVGEYWLDAWQRVASRGALSDEGSRRLARIEAMFAIRPETTIKVEAAHV